MRARRMQREIEDLQASIDALSLPGSAPQSSDRSHCIYTGTVVSRGIGRIHSGISRIDAVVRRINMGISFYA